MILDPKKIDQIYLGYNYENKSRKHRSVRVYAQKFGIYNAAEIIPLKEGYNANKLKKEYSELGYVCDVS